MTRAWIVAASLVTLGLPATASAGYIGLGIGSAPAVDDDDDDRQVLASTSRSGKLLAGTRWGRFSLEGALSGFGVARGMNPARTEIGDLYQISAAAKLNLPIGNNFEVFGRFGLAHSWVDTDDEPYQLEGNGILAGLGLEYRLDVGVAGASIFIDYQINRTELTGEQVPALELTSRMFSLGATVGF